MKQTYIRCPRCELNYILKKDKFCKVCKMEMKALGTLGAEENMDLELCPICKTNYINFDEDMCSQCAKERELEDGDSSATNKNIDDWNSYDGQEDDDVNFQSEEDGGMVSISNLDDTPLADDEMELDISDDEEDMNDEDESEDSANDDDFNLDDDDEDDYEDDEDDEDDDDDDYEDEKPSKKKK